MKVQPIAKRTSGMTLVEVIVVIFVVAFLAWVLLPALMSGHRTNSNTACVRNLMEIGLAFKIWEGDNGDKYPMQVYATNSDMMKRVISGNTWALWQTMSNELSTPKILHCPDDKQRTEALSFTQNFSDANISYFFNLDASDNYPQMILDGDDNLAVNGVRVPPGILNLQTNASVTWTKDRHQGAGNLGMADGSVQQATIAGLSAAFVNSGSVTNRLVIP
jgi:prepilin-type processing-associated H-X9-DG protein